ncbi:hypothetical protein TWF281_006532 [Arthrobotrys megalospora]
MAKRHTIPWDSLSDITDYLEHLEISRVKDPETETTKPAPENTPSRGLKPTEPGKDGPKRTYLPKKAPATLLPPRQDIKRVIEGGNNMASVVILQESLKYYEKARRIYENNLRTRDKLLAINALASQIIVNPGDKLEKQDDLILDYIQQALKQINKLLSNKNYDYDRSWGSMLDELDLDEGFFVTNISKIHQYGELYEFLVATRRVLGEYRMMESYLLWSSDQLAEFAMTKLGKYQELKSKINWNRVWYEIGEERKLLVEYTKEAEEYYQDIESMRHMKNYGHSVETFLPPEKPYTPYIDDIISASNDTGITHEYLAKEILFLAEEGTTGKNYIAYCLERNDLSYLTLRFNVDLTALRIIFHGHPDPSRYFSTKDRIEKFRRLLFVSDGDNTYHEREKWPIAGSELSRIFELKDEQKLLEELEEFLHNPKKLPGLNGEKFENEDDSDEYFVDDPDDDDYDDDSVAVSQTEYLD